MQYNPMKSFWKWERGLNSQNPELENNAWFVLDQEEEKDEEENEEEENQEEEKKRENEKTRINEKRGKLQRWENPLQQSLTISDLDKRVQHHKSLEPF